MTSVKELIKRYCIDEIEEYARDLNSACPVAQVHNEFSPESIYTLAERGDLQGSNLIWECLTCGLCRQITGNRIDMSRFIREIRSLAFQAGCTGTQTHGGMVITAQRLSTNPNLRPGSPGWIPDSLRVTRGRGVYLYWVGGAPYFSALVPDLVPVAIESARSAILLLNQVGIVPVVLEETRFSGHDLLWTGDVEGFQRLAEQNLRAIDKSGAKRIIVSSPEDYHTLSLDYGEYFGEMDFEVCHISEIIAEHLSDLRLGRWEKRLTYHDPCRLGRGMGIYDAPRRILGSIPGVELVEMEHTRELSRCCGTSCWTNCNRYSKLLQVNRLQEAADTGADLLVTSCWECAMHLNCAMRPSAWHQVRVEIADLVVLAGSLLEA